MFKIVQFLQLLLAVFLLFGNAAAQHPHFWNLTEDDGLPSNVVYDLLQDTNGYIWIGTDKGLVRYNGTRFQQFTSPQQKSLSLTHLQEDEEGRIWCVNFSRQVFFALGDSLFEFDIELQDKALEGNVKIQLIHNKLYVYSYQHADRYDVKTKVWERDLYAEYWPKSEVSGKRNSLFSISAVENSICLAFGNQAQLWPEQGKPTEVSIPPNSAYQSRWIDNSQLLLLDGNVKVSSLKKDTTIVAEAKVFSDPDIRLLTATKDRENAFWLCTSGGAVRLKTPQTEKGGSTVFFPDQQVSDMLLDNENNLWFSTLQNGIFVIPDEAVTIYNPQNSDIASSHIHSLGTDAQGNILLGTSDGTVQRVSVAGQFSAPVDFKVRKEVNGFVRNDEVEWAFGEHFFNLKTEVATPWRYPQNVKQMQHLGGNKFLYLSADALVLSNLSGQPIQPFPMPQSSAWRKAQYEHVLEQKGVRSFVFDTTLQQLYVATISGLFCYSDDGNIELKTKGGSAIFATNIVLDSFGKLWATTVSNGIVCFYKTELENQFRIIENEKAPRFSTLALDDRTVWAASDVGLWKINISDGKYELINRLDGLPSNNINDIVLTKEKVWVATLKGLVVLSKEHSSINSTKPRLELLSVAVNQESKSDISELQYTQNNITFHVSAIGFRNRGNGRINYRLVGHSNQWNEVPFGTEQIGFQALKPGNYTFEAMAVNEDNVESEPVISTFSILPPFWQTWWFYTVVLLLLIAIISAVFLLRIEMLKRRNRVQHDLRVSELTALKSQMNPHFVFNALNSIQEYVLTEQPEMVNDYLGRFARLMRKTLDQSQQTTVTLSEEIELLELYLSLEAIRFEDGFNYTIDIEDGSYLEEINIPPMIVQPFVENAVKHGLMHKKEDRELTITFSRKKDVLVCTILDNGIGLRASEKINAKRNQTHRSFGTGSIRKRLDLLNQGEARHVTLEMTDLSEADPTISGTRVVLRVPIKKQHHA